ncbi:hypothetical protein STEG23_020916 [Scotinomys teguina]
MHVMPRAQEMQLFWGLGVGSSHDAATFEKSLLLQVTSHPDSDTCPAEALWSASEAGTGQENTKQRRRLQGQLVYHEEGC